MDILKISSGKLCISDLRMGPTKDGLSLSVEPGDYVLSVVNNSQQVKAYELLKQGCVSNRTRFCMTLASEMNLFGCFDYDQFLKEFGDAESLFEWGDSCVEMNFSRTIFSLSSPAGNKILCLPVGSNESDHEIYCLLSDDQVVGLSIVISLETEYIQQVVDGLYKLVFEFRNAKLEAYISTEYDDESISDTLKDSILDFLQNDDLERVSQIFSSREPNIRANELLSTFDVRLSSLIGLQIYSVDENNIEKLVDSKNNFNAIENPSIEMLQMLAIKSINTI